MVLKYTKNLSLDKCIINGQNHLGQLLSILLKFFFTAMNKFKLSAKGTPLNSINDEYSSSEGEDEEHIDFDDSIDDY